jgi:putative FmdB family regulatory protein
MPMYQFHCKNCDEDIETFFGFNDKQEIDCEDCNTPMEKVFFAVGVVLKGTGWGGQ